MLRGCTSLRWTNTRSIPFCRAQLRCQLRTISSAEQSQKSSTSPATSRPRAWRQLVALAIIGIPVLFTAYYVLDQDSSPLDTFGKYKLVLKEPVSPSAAIFHIEPQNRDQEAERYREIWRQGIWNVQFKQPQLQIVRAYTPLPPSPLTENYRHVETTTLRFLIRNDPRGEVSGYLHRLPIESAIEVRGPNLEHAIGKDIKEVVFLAGGTGIAPALQVAHAMFDEIGASEAKGKKLHILWANRRREECEGAPSHLSTPNTVSSPSSWPTWFSWSSNPKSRYPLLATTGTVSQEQVQTSNPIVHQLSALQKRFPGQITVSHFIDEEKTVIDSKTIASALSRTSTRTLDSSNKNDGRKEIIISGPPGFIAHLAGPKVWQNGMEEQGPLRGLLGAELTKRRDLTNVRVWKV